MYGENSMTRYYVYVDFMNHADSHIGRRKFTTHEEAWLKCPENHCLAIGTWDELTQYFTMTKRTGKEKTSNGTAQTKQDA